MPATRWSILSAVLLTSALASAQAPDSVRPETLYVHTPLFIGSTRAHGVAGAWVGIAEGASYLSNHASFANPPSDATSNFDFDLQLGLAEPLIKDSAGLDWDNDGERDRVATVQLLMGAQLRYRAVGVGAYLRATGMTWCLTEACGENDLLTVSFGGWGVAAAVSLWDDQLIPAFGVHGALAGVIGREDESRSYRGLGPSADLLWRPKGWPFRLGLTYRPGVNMGLVPSPGASNLVAGRQVFAGAISPHFVSVGASVRLGDGMTEYNVRAPPPTAEDEGVLRSIFGSRPERVTGPWLLTAQLDFATPVEAVHYGAFVEDEPAVRVGASPMLAPRFGVEHTTLPGRLRLRAGGWLEPSAFAGRGPRPHATAGFDLFLFHLLLDFGVTAAIDVAPAFNQGTVSFGIWH